MGSGKNSIVLIIFVSLIAAAAVSTAQTITYRDNFTASSLFAGAGIFHPNATVFIVLTGFLCLSLVIERKLWLATLTAPLRKGQSGIQSISQLTGIPDGKTTFPFYISLHDQIRQKQNIRHAIHITNAIFKFSIKHFSSLHKSALICMALSYEQNNSFSPAFIFVRLARGPPILT